MAVIAGVKARAQPDANGPHSMLTVAVRSVPVLHANQSQLYPVAISVGQRSPQSHTSLHVLAEAASVRDAEELGDMS
jgi:hypothetical protein